MPSVFPYTNGTATTDSFSDPLSTSPLNSPSHSQLHQDINTAVETIETVLQSGGGSRNVLYNGAMQVAQRGTSTASITTSGYYTADRWKLFLGTAGTWTEDVTADAPTGSGFRNSFRVLCTTADASPAAGDFFGIEHLLEGQDLQAFRKGTAQAQQFTLSFWVKSNRTGTYICELRDNDNNRSISASYVVNSSATWEFKTITLAADTIGAFDNDNNLSLVVGWWLVAGSTYASGTLQTAWATVTNANRAVGQVNLASATNNYWQVTGVQLNVGGVAAPFEFKSFERELRECQRYYEKSYNPDVVPGTNTTAGMQMSWCMTQFDSFAGQTVVFQVNKRSGSYTFTAYTEAGTSGSWNYLRPAGVAGTAAVNLLGQGTRGVIVYFTGGGPGTQERIHGHWTASSEL